MVIGSLMLTLLTTTSAETIFVVLAGGSSLSAFFDMSTTPALMSIEKTADAVTLGTSGKLADWAEAPSGTRTAQGSGVNKKATQSAAKISLGCGRRRPELNTNDVPFTRDEYTEIEPAPASRRRARGI